MNKLEGVVRPFSAPQVFSAGALTPVQPNYTAKAPIVFTWGKAIKLQCKPIGITNLFGGERLHEISRTTVTKRVFQDDDPTSPNWVDVEQIKTLKMQDANRQEHEFEFTPQP